MSDVKDTVGFFRAFGIVSEKIDLSSLEASDKLRLRVPASCTPIIELPLRTMSVEESQNAIMSIGKKTTDS